MLPEVFLKAVALARNQGVPLTGLTTVNIDFVRLYRPQTNVVSRPTKGIGTGYSLIGHHELLIPLLAAALIESDTGVTASITETRRHKTHDVDSGSQADDFGIV